MVAASDANTDMKASGASPKTAVKTSDGTIAMPTAVHAARSARSGRPAPRFWPTIGPADSPKPTRMKKQSPSTRMPTPRPFCAAVPNCAVMRAMTTW